LIGRCQQKKQQPADRVGALIEILFRIRTEEALMELHDQISRIGSMAELDRLADPAAKAVKNLIRPGRLKDLLSGTWLGHPLHPVFTDVTIGSLTGATLLDFVGGRRGEPAADVLVGVGAGNSIGGLSGSRSRGSSEYANGSDQR
jgi:hypothetical protein